MYTPPSFVEHDTPTLLAFMDAHPLAAVVTGSGLGELVATHLPLVLDRTAGPDADIAGVVRGLNESNEPQDQAVASIVNAAMLKRGAP